MLRTSPVRAGGRVWRAGGRPGGRKRGTRELTAGGRAEEQRAGGLSGEERAHLGRQKNSHGRLVPYCPGRTLSRYLAEPAESKPWASHMAATDDKTRGMQRVPWATLRAVADHVAAA